MLVEMIIGGIETLLDQNLAGNRKMEISVISFLCFTYRIKR